MGFLTRYGTQFGTRTERHGRTIFVAPSAQYSGIASNITGAGTGTFGASDNNDGLSPERAVRTVSYAVNTLAQTGDTVVLLPGTHTVTTAVAPRAGVAIFGSGTGSDGLGTPYQPESILTSTATNTHLINVANTNVEIGYLTLRPTSGFSAIVFGTGATSAAGIGPTLHLHDFYLDLITPAVSLDTVGVDFTARSTSMTTGGFAGKVNVTTPSLLSTPYALIERGVFASGGAQGAGVHLATCWAHVRQCRFFNTQGAWATPFAVATNVDNSVVEGCIWTTSGTMGANVDGTTANTLYGILIANNRFAATVISGNIIDNFATTTASAVENYQAGSASAIVTIT